MTDRDAIAPLIPWYANGTLSPEESAEVEEHLASCDACRETLATARQFRRLAPGTSDERLYDHVQSQRLVEYADDPAALEPDARRFITDHLQGCAVCAEAVEILEEMRDATAAGGIGSPGEPRGASPWSDLWRRLSRTLLHPAPALAYLVALVVMVAVLPLRTPAPGQPPGVPAPDVPAPVSSPPEAQVLPPAVELPGELVFRGQGKPPEPMVVAYPAEARAVAVTLVADIEAGDLRDPAASFRVEINQGDRVILQDRRQGSDFDHGSRLTILINAAAVEAGVPCRLRLLLDKPGDPRHGEEIYRRSFLLKPEPRPPL